MKNLANRFNLPTLCLAVGAATYACADPSDGGLPRLGAGSPSSSATPSATPNASGQGGAGATLASVYQAAQDIKDIAYAEISMSQRLDLYLPERRGAAVPLVVNVHGGTFSTGDKADEMYNVAALRARGYAVANINYRLAGAAFFPAGAQDVKAAVRWLRAHAAQYGLDANRFAAWGSDAGGYMAAMLGVSSGQASVFDDPTLGNRDMSDAVQAVVALYAPSDFLTLDWQLAAQGCSRVDQTHNAANSPESIWLGGPIQTNARSKQAVLESYVSARGAKIPPFYFFHGGKDCSVPNRQSHELADALHASAISAEVMDFADAGHAANAVKNGSITPALDFLDRVMPASAGAGTVAPGVYTVGSGGTNGVVVGSGGTSSSGSSGTMDDRGVTQVPPTVTVNGRNIRVSGVVTWDRATNFAFRQIALRPPVGSHGTAFSTAFTSGYEGSKGQRTISGEGTCDVAGTWTAFETYAVSNEGDHTKWFDGPSVSFRID